MTAKDYLKQARKIIVEIKSMELQLADLELKEQSIISNYNGISVQVSPSNGAKFEKTVNEIICLRNKINASISKLIAVKSDIFSTIDKIEDSTLRTLLIHRYINGYSWFTISEIMGYNCEYVRGELHSKALEYIKK